MVLINFIVENEGIFNFVLIMLIIVFLGILFFKSFFIKFCNINGLLLIFEKFFLLDLIYLDVLFLSIFIFLFIDCVVERIFIKILFFLCLIMGLVIFVEDIILLNLFLNDG